SEIRHDLVAEVEAESAQADEEDLDEEDRALLGGKKKRAERRQGDARAGAEPPAADVRRVPDGSPQTRARARRTLPCGRASRGPPRQGLRTWCVPRSRSGMPRARARGGCIGQSARN